MPDPCEQKENITELQVTAKAQHESLRRIEKVLDVISTSLQELAAQRIEIRHLNEEVNENKKALDGLFKRVRDLELMPGKATGKVFWVTVTALAGVIGSLFTTLLRIILER